MLPQLHLITLKKDYRVTHTNVCVSARLTAATNGIAAVWYDTSDLFGQGFDFLEPGKWVYVEPAQWKKLTAKKVKSVSVDELNQNITATENDGGTFSVPFYDMYEKFPDIASVIPQDTNALCEIGVNAELLANVQKALGLKGVKLVFSAIDRAVRVYQTSPVQDGKDPETLGNAAIMPIRISG